MKKLIVLLVLLGGCACPSSYYSSSSIYEVERKDEAIFDKNYHRVGTIKTRGNRKEVYDTEQRRLFIVK